jgi:hypothetical protein
MLVIACLVVAASVLLEAEGNTEVVLAALPQVVVPPLCVSRTWFGVRCPGCGLTRSFVHLAHGRWQASWQAHRLGWLLAGVVVLQIPYRIHQLRLPHCPLLSPSARARFSQCLIGLLIANWLLETLVST